MKITKALLGLLVSVTVIVCLLGITGRATHAQGSGTDQSIAEKLDAIANTQKAILDDLASIKEELRIIKIRVTQTQ